MNYSIWDDDFDINSYERHLLERACIPEYQWVEADLTPARCDIQSYERLSHIRENLLTFISPHNDKNNLIICGKYAGNGKTSWAFKLMLTYIELNWKRIYAEDFEITDKQFDIALFISVVPFTYKLKRFSDKELSKEACRLYARAEKTELLILDDIGVVNMSDYDYSALYSIIESRNLAHLPTIITTNYTDKADMERDFGHRFADRVWEMSTIVEFKGTSRRAK